MPRKKNSYESDEKIFKSGPAKLKFVERDGRMITTERIYAKDDKSSMIVGVAKANEVVKILSEPTVSGMTKITTYVTNREGYVNSKSIY